MKQKSFDAVRQKSRALAVLLCLAVLLLTGCGGAAAPEPPASAPAAGRTDTPGEDASSSPAAPAPSESESESPSSSTAASEPEAQSPQEPEVEDFLRCEPMDYTSVSAVCSGQEGTLIVVKVRVENTTEQVVHAFNTSASLGNVTVDNAVDGMSADQVAAGKAAEHLTAVLRTTQGTVVKKPVVAAFESAAEALQPGQSAVAYGYVFLPASEGSWTRADFLWKEQAIGSLTPKKPQAPAESAAPSDSAAASMPSAKPEPPAASQPTASPGSPAGSEPSSQPSTKPEASAGSEHPAASEAPASPPASSAPSAPETPSASGTPASSEAQEPDTSAAFPEFTVLGQTLTSSGFCVHFRVKNHTKETLDLENTAAQFTDAADGTFREDRLYQNGTKSRWIGSLCYLTNGAQTDEYPCYVVTSARSTVLKPGASAEIWVYGHLSDTEKVSLVAVSLSACCGGKTCPIPDEDALFLVPGRNGSKRGTSSKKS